MKYIKTFSKLNESAQRVAHGGGEMIDPEEAKKALIQIKGIYFTGEGFRSMYHKNIWDKSVIELCEKLGADYNINKFGTTIIDTDDVYVYFHAESTAVKVKTDKFDLDTLTKWIANEISEFDLPIEVSYFYV